MSYAVGLFFAPLDLSRFHNSNKSYLHGSNEPRLRNTDNDITYEIC